MIASGAAMRFVLACVVYAFCSAALSPRASFGVVNACVCFTVLLVVLVFCSLLVLASAPVALLGSRSAPV
jgi:hypothetical protein